MRLLIIGIVVAILYTLFVTLIGFEGLFAASLNFLRVTSSVAVLILFIPFIRGIFENIPPPPARLSSGRAYLSVALELQLLAQQRGRKDLASRVGLQRL